MEIESQASPEAAEASTEGVTENSQAPAQDGEVAAEAQGNTEDKLPFGKHPRWQKMVQENRQFKSELQRVKQEFDSKKQAIGFYDWLQKSPDNFRSVMDIMEGKGPKQVDPYAEFDPSVAEKFRKLDSLEKWKADQEQKQRESQVKTVEGNRQNLDEEFENLLTKGGYLQEDGSHDEGVVALVSKATLATLMEIAEDPNFPTKSELHQAYKLVSSGLAAVNKQGQMKKVQPTVPQSGSRSVQIPKSEKVTQEDVTNLWSSFKQGAGW